MSTIPLTFLLLAQEFLTGEKCANHLIVRGLVRIRCVQLLQPIVNFLTRKGLINVGLLKDPPGGAILPADYCEVSAIPKLLCLLLKLQLRLALREKNWPKPKAEPYKYAAPALVPNVSKAKYEQ